MIFIDTHSHIDGPEFAEDLNEVILRAKDSNIGAIFIPGICLKDTFRIFDICKENKGFLFPMIGLHPENIMDEDYHMQLDKMEEMLEEKLSGEDTLLRPVAVGEVGIDLYWDATYKNEQIEVFMRQIGWAEKYDLPLMIHARNAQKELVEVMEEHRSSNLRGVFHCFSGTAEDAKELLSFEGFMLGIGGVLTFKKSTLPEILAENVPLERIVLETDAPYLAPVPHRGKRNESAYIPCVASKLSDIYGVSIEDIAQQTTKNVCKVFRNCNFFQKK